ncbi:MAG: pyrroline-5-carboxylate reductase [Acholeplasmataceae bacterium]|nr:pyrroline-5-carboxylate reductase [Acholeplasmataceae bacterium]
MAKAIFDSLVKSTHQLPTSIYLYDIDLKKTLNLSKAHNVNVAKSITEIASTCDVIVLAVRPHELDSVFDELSLVLKNQILFSVAVGITLDKLRTLAKKDVTIVRTMPNIGAMIGRSVTSYCVNKEVSKDESIIIDTFLNSFGKAIEIKEEKFDEFTALCGSSPAFYLEIMESMINYGLDSGFTYDAAVKMVSESMIISAELLQKSTLKTDELIKKIATPGGTTAAGLKVLNKYGINKIITETLQTTARESKKTK